VLVGTSELLREGAFELFLEFDDDMIEVVDGMVWTGGFPFSFSLSLRETEEWRLWETEVLVDLGLVDWDWVIERVESMGAGSLPKDLAEDDFLIDFLDDDEGLVEVGLDSSGDDEESSSLRRCLRYLRKESNTISLRIELRVSEWVWEWWECEWG
jgi:hypothetical protein